MAPVLQLDGVSKEYRAADGIGRVPVLNGVDLTLEAAATIAIVGPSGSGKTTLLNLMGTLDRPSSGDITLEGRRLAGLSEAELAEVRRRRIGFIFQRHHLLPQLSVLENVLLPSAEGEGGGPDPVDRARHLLNRVGLGGRLENRPASLSGGECQRVAVVRALINRPAIVLADEPTGSLDRRTADEVARVLLDLNREEGTALVVVTHAAEIALQMSRGYQLRDGVLVAA